MGCEFVDLTEITLGLMPSLCGAAALGRGNALAYCVLGALEAGLLAGDQKAPRGQSGQVAKDNTEVGPCPFWLSQHELMASKRLTWEPGVD